MAKSHSFRRLLSLTTALGLALPAVAAAQDAAAPPGRVGQIASLSGNVSFDGSGSGGWAQAVDNYPVSAGDSLYTQSGSDAAIALDSSQISLAPSTEIQVTALDDANFSATEGQGEIALNLQNLQAGQSYVISTPRGSVTMRQNGEYDIQAGDSDTPTIVNVYQGAASVSAPGADLQVAAGQAGVLSGGSTTLAQLGQAQQDSFTNTVFAQSVATPPAYVPPVVTQMTGCTELSRYGAWNQNPQYGAVWYPDVAAGWAPYRQGYWADVQPWGWTWVESEPWGFAPFHYGRWLQFDGRWGWVPAATYDPGAYGPAYQPVYAPAVVSFFGIAAGAITIAALSSGSVGWVPLAPNEPYYPPYRAPAAYIRNINYVNVRNINEVHITNNYYYGGDRGPERFANHGAATFVAADVMRRGQHVAAYAHAPTPEMLKGARPIDPAYRQGGAGTQSAAFHLPQPGQPLARLRPGHAPTPSAFAQRREVPQASMSHTPFAGHAPENAARGIVPPHGMNAAMPENRPGFATAPGFHAPPAPPSASQHLGTLPPAGNFHPAAENHAASGSGGQYGRPPQNAPAHPKAPHPEGQEFHPGAPAYHAPAENPPPSHAEAPARDLHPAQQQSHPPAPQQFHPPAPQHRPPEQQFHPQPQPYHPPGQQFRPQEPQYHPQEQQFRPPAPAPRPSPPPRPEARPEPPHGGNEHHQQNP